MFPGYKQKILNNHALGALVNKNVDIPEPALGIGFAEKLAPVKNNVEYKPVQRPARISPVRTLDDVESMGTGKMLSPADFATYNYLGEGLA